MTAIEPGGGPRTRSEDGVVAGAEALAFGVLIFVIGTLVVLNGWSAVDAKFAASAAARESVRAVTQSPVDATTNELEQRALAAATQAAAAHGHGAEAVTLTVADPPLRLERCRELSITAAIEVTGVLVPGVVEAPRWTVASRHQQLVDPYRSGLDLDGWDGCGA